MNESEIKTASKESCARLLRRLGHVRICFGWVRLSGGRLVSFALVISFHRYIIRFGEHGAYSFKARFARRKDTEEMLWRIIRVRHDRVQCGEIVVADVDLVRSKQCLESLPAHTDIQTKNTWTVKVWNLFIIVACGCNRCERMHEVISVEKERVPILTAVSTLSNVLVI